MWSAFSLLQKMNFIKISINIRLYEYFKNVDKSNQNHSLLLLDI